MSLPVAGSGLNKIQTSEIGGFSQGVDVLLAAVGFPVLRPLSGFQ